MKRLTLILAVIFLSGCSMMQIREMFAGMYVEDVENAKVKYSRTFNEDASYCFDRVLDILKKLEAQVVRSDPKTHFIAANKLDKFYSLCIDTTEAGILITPQEDNKTRIDIASQNTSLAKALSEHLFKELTEEIPDNKGKQ